MGAACCRTRLLLIIGAVGPPVAAFAACQAAGLFVKSVLVGSLQDDPAPLHSLVTELSIDCLADHEDFFRIQDAGGRQQET